MAIAMNHSVRRLSRLAKELWYRSYLEIGVETGATFNNFDIAEKDAVDPHFLFDAKSLARQSIRYFETTSDHFFVNSHKNKKYDLVFIDGLHTFEQTFRDFCSTLSAIHDQSCVLIDDVCPSDIFSAHPDQKTAYRFRAQHIPGTRDRQWHGDTYKIIFAIHDFFPNLSYRTINSKGNPQAIVWRRPRAAFAPIFNNLERISRLNYYDIFDNLNAFKLGEEDEVLNDVIQSMRKGI